MYSLLMKQLGWPVMVLATVAIWASIVSTSFADEWVVSSEKKSEEEVLRERVSAYWEARKLHDFNTIYDLESEGGGRGWLTPMLAPRIGNEIEIVNLKIASVDIIGEEAKVNIDSVVRFHNMKSTGKRKFPQKVTEAWLKLDDGLWYHKTLNPDAVNSSVRRFNKRREQERLEEARQAMEAAPEK